MKLKRGGLNPPRPIDEHDIDMVMNDYLFTQRKLLRRLQH